MANPRPVHFEIHADDLERAAKFYSTVFGWTFETWKAPGIEYMMAMTGPKEEPGINGGLVKRHGPRPEAGAPATAFVCTMEVDNVDAYVEKATKAGGVVALPKMAIPTVGWLAYIIDTEGNIFGLMQTDKGAK